MLISHRLLLALFAATAFGPASAPETTSSSSPVVIELFTSQGCSSCPPADAFAEHLSNDPGIVQITRPVTYWDRLGWKDTLAREENTKLQRDYAARGGVGSGVYTPQTMVQGRLGAVGSDRTLIRHQIAEAREGIAAAISVKGQFVGVAGAGGPADLRIVALKSSRIIRIGSGENGGRVIRYSNIVLAEKSFARWSGGTTTFKLPAYQVGGADRYAIILQSGTGPILAGAYL